MLRIRRLSGRLPERLLFLLQFVLLLLLLLRPSLRRRPSQST